MESTTTDVEQGDTSSIPYLVENMPEGTTYHASSADTSIFTVSNHDTTNHVVTITGVSEGTANLTLYATADGETIASVIITVTVEAASGNNLYCEAEYNFRFDCMNPVYYKNVDTKSRVEGNFTILDRTTEEPITTLTGADIALKLDGVLNARVVTYNEDTQDYTIARQFNTIPATAPQVMTLEITYNGVVNTFDFDITDKT